MDFSPASGIGSHVAAASHQMAPSVLFSRAESFVDALREVLVQDSTPGYRDEQEGQQRFQLIAVTRLQELLVWPPQP